MAKKKRKKQRRPQSAASSGGGAATTTQERTTSRQERKEQARRERERRIREARRRRRMRRLARWGIAAAVVVGVGGFIFWQTQQSSRLAQAAEEAANRLGCGAVQELTDEGTTHQPPYEYDTVPANSGPHSPQPMPAEPRVYDQPIPEEQAVHNLEHGYVLMYYRPGGEGALPAGVVDQLAGVAEGESEVLMAPYPGLPDGTSLALVAWSRMQTCPAIPESGAGDATRVAEGFITEFKNSSNAPEAEVP